MTKRSEPRISIPRLQSFCCSDANTKVCRDRQKRPKKKFCTRTPVNWHTDVQFTRNKACNHDSNNVDTSNRGYSDMSLTSYNIHYTKQVKDI